MGTLTDLALATVMETLTDLAAEASLLLREAGAVLTSSPRTAKQGPFQGS